MKKQEVILGMMPLDLKIKELALIISHATSEFQSNMDCNLKYSTYLGNYLIIYDGFQELLPQNSSTTYLMIFMHVLEVSKMQNCGY